MLRKLLGLVAVVTAATLVATAVADDKKETKLEGKLLCGKCKLKESEDCSNVLVVKDGEKSVNYYIKDTGKKEKYHVCGGEKDVTVTGKVEEKDGKKFLTDVKVEEKK
jgi:Family of unknown function (DUF6370)